MKYFIVLIFFTFSFAQKHYVKFESLIGECEITINGKEKFTLPNTLDIARGEYDVIIKSNSSDFEIAMTLEVYNNLHFVLNNKKQAFVEVKRPAFSHRYRSGSISSIFFDDGEEKKLINFNENETSKTIAFNANAKMIIISSEEFISISIPVDAQNFEVIKAIDLKIFPKSSYINMMIKKKEQSRRATVEYIAHGITAYAAYLAYESLSSYDNSNKIYNQYLEAKTDDLIQSKYKAYQKSQDMVNKKILYSALAIGVSVYLYFYESYSDLSDEYIDVEKTAINVDVGLNQVSFTYNF